MRGVWVLEVEKEQQDRGAKTKGSKKEKRKEGQVGFIDVS